MMHYSFEAVKEEYSPYDNQPVLYQGKTEQTVYSKELDNLENGYYHRDTGGSTRPFRGTYRNF